MTAAEMAYTRSAADSSDELVMQELSQVYYIAARIRERLPQHVELQDLVSAGVTGLLEANRTFDPTKNAQFKTFAKFRIRGAILDSLREIDWGSRTVRRRAREIAEATARLEGRLSRHPSESEIAEEMQIDVDHLRRIVAQIDNLQIVGQQLATSSDESATIDIVESAPDDDPNPFELCFQEEMKEHLAAAIAKLSEREQLILSLYYKEELTMKEIAQIVGVALSRVSQIHQATVLKLRESLAHVEKRPDTPKPKTGGNATYA
jgi:RNA polymerase sigma factor FliA